MNSDEARAQTRALARGGAVSLAGALVSAVAGFLVIAVFARLLGATGTGLALQAVAVFTIGLGVAKLGMDSAAVWLVPRLKADDPTRIRPVVTFLIAIAAVASSVVAAGVVALSGAWASLVGAGPDGALVLSSLIAHLPAAAITLVLLGAVRALGSVRSYVVIGSLAIPLVRLVAVVVFGAAGVLVATQSWAIGWTVGLIAIGIVALKVLPPSQERWPTSAERRQILEYGLPRTVSAGMEQVLIWSDVILVGMLAGSTAAGVYGAASRFVAAGLVAETAVRVLVSPRFSLLAHRNETALLQHLYSTAATWLVLLSAPIYLVLGAFAPQVLSWFGPGFEAGADTLLILCVGGSVAMAAGNVHSLLLMGGRSDLAALNKVVVVVLNVIGNLTLVPLWGINGAAVSWASAMLVDAALAAVQVRRGLGVSVQLPRIAYALSIPVLCVGLPAAISIAAWGRLSPMALAVTIGVGALGLLTWCIVDRKRLRLDELRG